MKIFKISNTEINHITLCTGFGRIGRELRPEVSGGRREEQRSRVAVRRIDAKTGVLEHHSFRIAADQRHEQPSEEENRRDAE